MIETIMRHLETGERIILYINSAHISAFMPSNESGWINVVMSNGIVYEVRDSLSEFFRSVERANSKPKS